MSKDYERLSQASGQKRGKRGTIIMLAIAFVAGVILSGWAITRYNIHEKITPADEKAQIADDTHQTVAALDQRINEDGTVAPPTNEEDSEPLPDITADQERALATKSPIWKTEFRASMCRHKPHPAMPPAPKGY